MRFSRKFFLLVLVLTLAALVGLQLTTAQDQAPIQIGVAVAQTSTLPRPATLHCWVRSR